MSAIRVSHLSDPRQIAQAINIALKRTDTQAPVPDTSGATLAALEAELNKLKAALRAANIIAP